MTATYNDNGGDATPRAMSAKVVQAIGGGAENGSPDFLNEKAERTVAESVAVGSPVGAPVVASVKSQCRSKDTLTYRLRAFTANDVGNTGLTFADIADAAADLAAFDIRQGVGTDHHGGQAGL